MLSELDSIISDIKKMNTIFERPEGSGAVWENEFLFFLEELNELKRDGRGNNSLVETTDALIDIFIFAVGAMHKDGSDTQSIATIISQGQQIDIYKIDTVLNYKDNIGNILYSILFTLSILFGEGLIPELFHEVYLSNMSKLKDGRPVPGSLPGKFGKNMDTYFKPDIRKYIQNIS